MKIAKWETFQGYQKTGPKWIKLHAGLIDKPEWMRLPLVAKAVLPLLWIAASRSGSTGELPDEPAMIAILCHMRESEVSEALPSLIAAGFIECEGFVAHSAKDLSQAPREEYRPRERESREREERTTPVQPTSSSSVDSRAETAPRSDADDAKAELISALQAIRARRSDLDGLTDQQILDRPEYHAPSGPVRLATCGNPALMLATAGKLRARPKKPKGSDSTNWAAAEAAEAREVDGWIRANWGLGPFTAPTTIDELREGIAALKPPLHLAQAIEAALLPRYPAADADLAARVERMRPAESRQTALVTVDRPPTTCPECGSPVEARGALWCCTDSHAMGCDWSASVAA